MGRLSGCWNWGRNAGSEPFRRPQYVVDAFKSRVSGGARGLIGIGVDAGRASNHAEMPKRLFDRLTLFWRARLDVTAATGPVRPTERRYAVNLLDMSDPPRFRDEALFMTLA